MTLRFAPPIAALILLISVPSNAGTAPAAPDVEPLVVFLVRHGEKVDSSKDPELSAAGRARAAVLARSLRSAGIEYVHSSDFIRTRETATPTAAEIGLEVELYDPRNLPALVEKLRAVGGRHLVVGHSNTTPPLVGLLGGRPGEPIDEAREYDRLYVVTVAGHGVASSVLLRYGETYDPGPER